MVAVAHPKLSRYPPSMRRETYALWILPAGQGRRQRVSSWKMNATEAAALGAVGIVPGSTEIRELPESDAERLAFYAGHPSAGRDGVKPRAHEEKPPANRGQAPQ